MSWNSQLMLDRAGNISGGGNVDWPELKKEQQSQSPNQSCKESQSSSGVQIKIEEGCQGNIDQMISLSLLPHTVALLPHTIEDLVKTTFRNSEEMQSRKIIDQIISKAPVSCIPQHEHLYPFSHRQPTRGRPPKNEKDIKVFIDLNPFHATFPLYITLMDSKKIEGKNDIVFRISNGEILFYAQGYLLDEIPKQLSSYILQCFSSVIIQNRARKSFLEYAELPGILTKRKQFAWCEYHYNREHTQKDYLQKLRQNNFEGTYLNELNVIFPFKENVRQITLDIDKQLKGINYFENLVSSTISKECPELKNAHYSFIRYLVLNAWMIKYRNHESADYIQVLPILNEMLALIINHLINTPKSESKHSSHYPVKLSYPKHCHVCKKDNRQYFPPSKRQSIRKTKYGCQGCTAFFRTEIRLCVLCFQKFHHHMAYYVSKKGERINDIILPPPYCRMRIPVKNEMETREQEEKQPEKQQIAFDFSQDMRGRSEIIGSLHKLLNMLKERLRQ